MDAGQVNNAMKLIIDDGKLLAPTDATLTALKEKHPPISKLTLPTLLTTAQPLIIERNMIEAAIQSMNTASAAGPDGLRPSHLKQFTGKDAGNGRDKLLDSLQSFAAVCVAGKVPPSISKFVCWHVIVRITQERRRRTTNCRGLRNAAHNLEGLVSRGARASG